MKVDLSKSVAIVTGGSKGYGTGIAEALKQNGVNVWITGRDEKALETTSRRLKVHAVKADVTSAEDWDRLFNEVLKATEGRLDILVNNAGGGISIASVEKQTAAQIEDSIAVNLTGAVLGCRLAAAVMCKQRTGTIINVSSVCACEAWPGWAIYSAAKAGLVQFSKCLYTELRPAGVRVTSVIPSWGATEFLQTANLSKLDAEINDKCIQPIELGEIVVNICSLPPHLEIQEITVLPLVQEIIPL